LKQILIVEDDHKVADFLARGLKAEGYFTTVVSDGALVLPMLASLKPDLVILDRMLPHIDGLALCQLIRAQKIAVRILMLSALADTKERVQGLKSGADDYLTKPFAFEELLARLENLLQRDCTSQVSRTLTFGNLVLDLELMQARRDGQLLVLTATELRLLELMMATPNKIQSRERILTNVWGINQDPQTNVVDVYIKRLRQKVDAHQQVKYIRTLRGIGYFLSED
jgi:DNA-binding response OmpR family regulator